MHVHVYERVILSLTVILLAVAMLALAGSVFAGGRHLPGPVMVVNPTKLRETPPFDHPGVTKMNDGTYHAVMVAQAWAFTPAEIIVPAGSSVMFEVASIDVTHGFLIQNTDVNLTLVPGHVAEATATFSTPGTYLLLCHEYCGIGHQTMFARVVVQ